MNRRLQVLALALASAATSFAAGQGPADGLRAEDFIVREDGAPGDDAELRAFGYVRARKLIKAREAGEALVRERPDSYVGRFVLAWAHHYAEANFPMARFHMNEAMRLFTLRHGEDPRAVQGFPWRWHARFLNEMAAIAGDLEEYEERLGYIARYNEHYQPKIMAERAWPLMKLRRFDDARAAAREGLASGDPRQVEIALNSLCAVEFEAGDDRASYAACRRAVEHARQGSGPTAVDLANFAEASRSVFKLAEAERTLLEATEAAPAWYGNPWLELGELYTRGARFTEALSALKKVPPYRAQRPPHVRDADRNESRRALAAFFLTIGRADEALAITEEALVTPDRRGHNSRDPAQDRAIAALLDRRARLTVAARREEAAATEGLGARLVAWFDATRLRFEGWLSGRQAVKLLSGGERLVGMHRVGTSRAAVVPPWLLGELAEVAGPGVALAAIEEARGSDPRAGAEAYYDAFAAEAELVSGDEMRAIELAEQARSVLGAGESLLRARADAIRAEAMRRIGDARAPLAYEAAVEDDPGVFRRLGFVVPVRFEQVRGGDVEDDARAALARTPRFDDAGESGALTVRLDGDAARLRICLMGSRDTVYDCAEGTPDSDESPDDFAGRVAREFIDVAFAPRIDLSQGDIGSLDGSNATARDPLDGIGRGLDR
ncbi:MAG: tetratricopeptide repeat protein [Myxococcota bacterium]